MKKFFQIITWLLSCSLSYAQTTVQLGSGGTVNARGAVMVNLPGGSFVNNGAVTDSSGTMNVLGPVTFSGSGTTRLYNLGVNTASGTSLFSSLVSVYNTATISAGSVNANDELYIRSDVRAATMVNDGVLTNDVQGLIALATVTTGGCPSYSSTLSLNISGTSMLYQWQSSADSSSWSNVSGATNASYPATVTSTIYYRCNLSTSNSSFTESTPGVKLTFNVTSPAAIAGTFGICNETSTTLTDISGGGTWSTSDASVVTIGSSSGIATGVSPGTATIVYSTGCGTPATQTFTVNPYPSVDPVSSQVVCNTVSTTEIDFTGSASGATYSWTNDNSSIGVGASGSGNISAFAGTNSGTSAIQGDFTVSATANGCTGTAQTFTVTVNPTPNVTQPSNQSVCNTAFTTAVNFTGGVSGASYSWSNDNSAVGLGGSGTGNISAFEGTNSGTSNIQGVITVTPSAAGCTGTAQTFTVTVKPTPTVTEPSNQAVCNTVFTTEVDFSGGVSGSSFAWSNNNTAIGLSGSGTGNILTFEGTNSGTSPIQGVIAVTPSNNGCTGAIQTFTVTVNPTPTVTQPGNQAICNTSFSTEVDFTGGVSGTSFGWSNSYTAIGLGASGTGNISSFEGTNSGASGIQGVISIVPTANGCTGATQTFTVTVNPTPNVSAPANQAVCNTVNTTAVNFTGGVTGSSFSWTNSNPSIGLGASGTGNIAAFEGTNSGTAPIQGVISVTPSYSGCPGAIQTFTVVVNPTPNVTEPSNQAVCNTVNTTEVDFTGGVSGTTYTWTNSNTSIGLAGSGTSNILSFEGTNSGTSAIQGVVSVTPSANSCTGAAQTFTVTVNPTPTVTQPGNQAVCNTVSTSPVTFSGGVSGSSFTWTNSNTSIGLDASGSGNISAFEGTNSGTSPIQGVISVTPSANGCTGTAQTFTVTVNPAPNVTEPTNQSICNTFNSAEVDFSGGVSGTNFSWTNSNTSIGLASSGTGNILAFEGTNSGTSAIQGVISVTPSANGCSGPVQTFTVTVNPTPTVAAPSNQAVCNSVNTSAVTFSGGVSGTSFSWTNDNTAIGLGASGTGNIDAFEGTNTTDAAIQGVISVTPSANGCTGTAQTFTVTVNPSPDAGAITGAGSVAIGQSITLTDAASSGVWVSSIPATATVGSATGIVTGVAAGSTIISYVVTNSCGTTAATQTVIVSGAGVISGTLTVCDGASTTLSETATGGTWSSGNVAVGTVSTSGVVTGVSAGTVIISYSVTGVSATVVVTVNPTPNIVSIGNNGPVCAGNTLNLTSSANGGTGSLNYSWTGPNLFVSTIANPFVSPATTTATGVYSLSVTDANTCMTSGITSATVTPLPSITAINNSGPVCVGNTLNLTSTATGGTGALAYVWAGPNTFTATISGPSITSVTTAAAGVYTLTVMDANNCTATGINTTTAVVNALPVMSPSAVTIFAGSPVTLSASGESNYTWSPATALSATTGTSVTASPSVNVTYTATGATSGCSNTVVVSMNVIQGPGSVCTGIGTTFTDVAGGGIWTSSNTSAATVGSLTGIVTGVVASAFTLSYSVSGHILTKAITVVTAPLPITGSGPVCALATITLADATSGGTWSSSNNAVGTVGTTGIVTGVSAGVINISYSISAGCASIKAVTVNASPTAVAGPALQCSGTPTQFTDGTGGGVWTSSNTSAATVGSLTGIVTGAASPSMATISYTISGCSATKVVSVYPTPNAISGTAAICQGFSTTLADATTGGTWSSTAPSLASVGTSGITAGVAVGTAVISYTLSTGCAAIRVATVNVSPTAITGVYHQCTGEPTQFTNGVPGGIWTSSNTAAATVGSLTGAVSGVNPGSVATISYSIAGCSSNYGVSVTATPNAVTGSATLCTGHATTYTDATTGGAWSSGSSGVATIGTTGIVSGVGSGTSLISYTVPTGCASYKVINVNTSPDVITGTVMQCSGLSTQLSDVTPGGLWTSSNTSSATVGSLTGLVSGVASSSAAIITYSIAGCYSTFAVTVNATPGAISGSSSGCTAVPSTYTDLSTGGAWSSSNPSVATIGTGTGIVNGVASGTTTISYTFPTGCAATKIINLNLTPSSISGVMQQCSGDSTQFTNATPGGIWTTSNTSAATVGSLSGVVTGIAEGIVSGFSVANISYSTGTGCSSFLTVSVYPTPYPISGSTNQCTGVTTNLISATSGGAWTSTNLSVATVDLSSGAITGVALGTTTISYTVPSGCATTYQVTVNITPAAMVGTSSVCTGVSYTFTDASPGGTWSSSNVYAASVVSGTGVVTGVTAGPTAYITYTVPTGCLVTSTVQVNASPYAVTGAGSVQQGTSTTFTDATSGGIWTSSSPSSATVGSTTGSVTGVALGSAVITYTLASGCSSSAEVAIVPFTGRDAGGSTGVNENTALGWSLKIIPNPNNGEFKLLGSMGTLTDEEVTLLVTDITGQEVYHNKLSAVQGDFNATVQLGTSLPNGLYYLNIQNGGNNEIIRFVVER